MERQIKESTLAQFIPKLDKRKITKAMEKNNSKFAPKCRAFHILNKDIEDVVTKSTQI